MAVAAFVGVVPGKERRFYTMQTQRGEVTSVVMTWPIDSISGPTLGSTRALAIEAGAVEGDLCGCSLIGLGDRSSRSPDT